VTWREGVHLTDTAIWCDARRRRDVCFVSSADRIGRAGHGQLIGTPLTLALVGADAGHLAVPLRQRFTLGQLRLELIASGRGPGAAALFVDRAGKRILYAGPVRTAEGAGDVAEVRACDTLIVAAPYGERRHRFPSLANAIAKTIAWTRGELERGKHAVLLVDTALDGFEVARVLAPHGIALAGSAPIRELAKRARAVGMRTNGRARSTADDTEHLGPTIAVPSREPRATLWLASDPKGLARAMDDRKHSLALVSARALGGSGVDDAELDAAFVWPNAADRASLLAWIEATKAKEIFVTGECAAAIVAALGDKAKFLGPPQQLSLFKESA
jgi:hypothetical protein